MRVKVPGGSLPVKARQPKPEAPSRLGDGASALGCMARSIPVGYPPLGIVR
jgi:hypothetical protein